MTSNEAVQLIEASSLFDASWYLEHYPDVEASKMNPAHHFYKYGWKMMRDPSNQFSTAGYLKAHKDVRKKSVNPLLHYLQLGKNEGRSIVASYQPEKFNAPKITRISLEPQKVARQLAETQALLEKYYRRCQELECQTLDQKIKPESP
ncbi:MULTISPECIES: hypothetical protein [unclassified Halomonas]|uniref:hypothetical protein n=1 Tax=unclassified Halomonas TaxID=2609666 RepID=UPI0020769D0F|nr:MULTISPECIES: hypothetical protein [unclassified Halomonas]